MKVTIASVLLVCTALGLGSYILWDSMRQRTDQTAGKSEDTLGGATESSGSASPSGTAEDERTAAGTERVPVVPASSKDDPSGSSRASEGVEDSKRAGAAETSESGSEGKSSQEPVRSGEESSTRGARDESRVVTPPMRSRVMIEDEAPPSAGLEDARFVPGEREPSAGRTAIQDTTIDQLQAEETDTETEDAMRHARHAERMRRLQRRYLQLDSELAHIMGD